jgi:hypothetical protein
VFFSTAFDSLEHRLKWDESVTEARVLSKDPETKVETIYWVTSYPWPISPRDYVLHRLVSHNLETGALCGTSWAGTQNPFGMETKPVEGGDQGNRNKSLVRVTTSSTTLMVVPGGIHEGGSMWAIRVLDDPKVPMIPNAVVNFIVSRTLPNSIKNLDEACKTRAHGLS